MRGDFYIMRTCNKCGQLTDQYYSKRHLKCIDCFKVVKREKTPDWVMQKIKKGRHETIQFIKRGKPKDVSRLLDCTHARIIKHIEKQFQPGMTWFNHGHWHLDHIIPLSSARTDKQLEMLFRWKNVRPLWAEANLKKKDNGSDDQVIDAINKKMLEKYEQFKSKNLCTK